jgi:sulfate ABC transporter permease protein CysW/sulfate ABC transporter permease protein CysT
MTTTTPAEVTGHNTQRRNKLRGEATSLRVGVAVLWLSVIVLLPLAAIAWQSVGGGWDAFWLAVTSNAALESFRVTLTISAGVTVVNMFFGLLIAWVLVRDEFPGKRLVDAIIDLPFALPTIVASLVMLALYGNHSPVGLHLQHTGWGVGVALAFVTLPFVVRAVQPVLLEVDRETEEAAASLGANNATIFTTVVLPALTPVLLTGAGLTFARAIGEFGSVVLIGGAVPGKTEVSSQWIRTLIENDDRTGAAAISIVLLAISFVVLFVLRTVGSRAAKREELAASLPVRYLIRFVALAYVLVLLVVPVSLILWRTFTPGFGQFVAWVSTPAAISALNLSMLVVAIVVPLNVIFGIPTALVLARNRFRGKGVLQAIIDLPFAVSPVVVGVALIVLWGSAGLLGFVERDFGFKIIFGLPGIVLASVFATLPFVVREVEPVLHEVGTDQEQAAATLGSSWWQTFWRITLPSIRWGLTYGIVLTVARTLGEYGAVIMVSSNLPGQSQTLTLLVSDRYNRGAEYGAYAISTLLMVVSVFVLIVQVILDARLKRATKQP